MKRKLITMAAAFLGAAVFFASGGAGFAQQDKADKPEAKKKPAAVKTVRPAKKAPRQEKKTEKKPAAPAKEIRRPARANAPAMVKRPWMGVATKDLVPILREHLDIAEGFGVQIVHVIPGSPADKAGLKPADILTKLEEQLLTTPEHLALLVRSKKKGDKVPLTIIRKGKEQTVTVTLGENDVPEWTPGQESRPFDFRFEPGPGGRGPWQFHGRFDLPEFQGKNWNETLRQYQDQMKEWLDKRPSTCPLPQCKPPAPPREKGARPDLPKPPPALPAPDNGPSVGSKTKDSSSISARVSVVSGKPPAISVRPGFPIEVFGSSGMVEIDNPEGEVTISEKDGKHTIAIKNSDAETVYDGNFDPKKGVDALPKEARDLLKKMKLNELQLVMPIIEENCKKNAKKSKSKAPGTY